MSSSFKMSNTFPGGSKAPVVRAWSDSFYTPESVDASAVFVLSRWCLRRQRRILLPKV